MAMEGRLAEESNKERDRAVKGLILSRVIFMVGYLVAVFSDIYLFKKW